MNNYKKIFYDKQVKLCKVFYDLASITSPLDTLLLYILIVLGESLHENLSNLFSSSYILTFIRNSKQLLSVYAISTLLDVWARSYFLNCPNSKKQSVDSRYRFINVTMRNCLFLFG